MHVYKSSEFGEAVRGAREAKGWKKFFLAAAVGCDPSSITNCEAGCVPKRRLVRGIAEALGIEPGRLLLLAGYAPPLTPQEADRIVRALKRWRS